MVIAFHSLRILFPSVSSYEVALYEDCISMNDDVLRLHNHVVREPCASFHSPFVVITQLIAALLRFAENWSLLVMVRNQSSFKIPALSLQSRTHCRCMWKDIVIVFVCIRRVSEGVCE